MAATSDAPRRHRRNAPETKARIIEAAQEVFSVRGYAEAGLREIAARAGVAASLIVLHFGSKAALFEAALVEASKTAPILNGPRSTWGRAIVDYGFHDDDVRLPAMMALSTGDADAREITGRVMRDWILVELAQRLGPPDAAARAVEISLLSAGFAILGRQLPLDEVSEASKLRMAKVIQAIIDEADA